MVFIPKAVLCWGLRHHILVPGRKQKSHTLEVCPKGLSLKAHTLFINYPQLQSFSWTHHCLELKQSSIFKEKEETICWISDYWFIARNQNRLLKQKKNPLWIVNYMGAFLSCWYWLNWHISPAFRDLEAPPVGVYVWPGKEITKPTSASAEMFGSVLATFLPTLPLVVNWRLGSWCACSPAAADQGRARTEETSSLNVCLQ